MGVHDLADDVPDLSESETAVHEGFDGDFVGCVHDGRHGSAEFPRPAGECQRRESVFSWCFENEAAKLAEIQRSEGIGDSIRPGDGILDRETHIGFAHLGDDGAIDVFYHGVNDALGMDDDVHAVHWNIEKPAGFDHFQPLVEHGGGVDGYFASHVPGGMLQCLFQSDGGKGVFIPSAEWSSGCRQNEARHLVGASVIHLQALVDGIVFAVYGQDVDTGLASGGHDYFSSHYQDFLTGDGKIFAGFNGG